MYPLNKFQPKFHEKDILSEQEAGRKFWHLVFPQHFPNGIGGLHLSSDDLTETDFIRHCLHYHTRQFAQDIEFILVAYHRHRKRAVSGMSLLASEHTPASDFTSVGQESVLHTFDPTPTVGAMLAAAEQVSSSKQSVAAHAAPSEDRKLADAKRLVGRLKKYATSLPESAMHMEVARRHLLAMIESGVMDNPFSIFVTYGSNDQNWPEVYRMIDAKNKRENGQGDVDLERESKAVRLKHLVENPLIATVHYFDRERALWTYILHVGDNPSSSAYHPLGAQITEFVKRRDPFQRGSFHTHVLATTKIPRMFSTLWS